MQFKKLSAMSVFTSAISGYVCLPENDGCIPSAVVIMTTADGIHPAFSRMHPKLFIISDFYRVLTKIAEVHADIARSFLKCIIPLLPQPFECVLNTQNECVTGKDHDPYHLASQCKITRHNAHMKIELVKMLSECQTAWIRMSRRVTRHPSGSKLFAYNTLAWRAKVLSGTNQPIIQITFYTCTCIYKR